MRVPTVLRLDSLLGGDPDQIATNLRLAPAGEGPYAFDWQDKPHRLIYDAASLIETQAEKIGNLATYITLLENSVLEAEQYLADEKVSRRKGYDPRPAIFGAADEIRQRRSLQAGQDHPGR